MVKIRLYRTGATKRPKYRVVAMDQRKKRQGRVLEFLGTYEPVKDGESHLRLDAIEAWVQKGAQVSDTVRSLIKKSQAAPAADVVGEAASV